MEEDQIEDLESVLRKVAAWKVELLSRLLAGYVPCHYPCKDRVLKSSRDICDELEEMGEFSIEEVSAFMAGAGYRIVIEDSGAPRWLMRRSMTGQPPSSIPE